ncbi:MAG: acyl carrier protein [Janthinobacterium lividum]
MSDLRTLETLKSILGQTLSLGERKNTLEADTELLGGLPELDSMGVINIVAALEEHFDISIEDDEISAQTFATLGSLAAFVDGKIAG